MSRPENYFHPVKNFFNEEFKKHLIEYYRTYGIHDKNLNNYMKNESPNRRALFLHECINDSMIKQYANLYGAKSACFMVLEKLATHRDSLVLKHINLKRSCVLTLPLEPDHTQFGKLNFYENENDTIPDVILDYNARDWQPYLLNIDKWHSVDRTGNPSLTFQLLYDDYEKALKILSSKKLLDIRHRP